MVKNYENIKQLDAEVKDPYLGVNKKEYDAYLREYLSTQDPSIFVIDYPNLFMQLASIAGVKRAYAEDELEIGATVKSKGARN